MSQARPIVTVCIAILGLSLLAGCMKHPIMVDAPLNEPGQARLENLHPRVVLVLGSGSARGFAHAGVLKVLEKNHIPIDLIVGTSSGSIVGSLYADNPNASKLQHLLLTTRRDEVINFSLLHLFHGPVSGFELRKFLKTHLRSTNFEDLKIPFIAVATDLQTGKAHIFGSGPIAPAVNASSAIPPYFPPIYMYGHTYADGGLVDPVAVDVAQQFSPKVIIAVKLDFPIAKEINASSPENFIRGFNLMLLKLSDYSSRDADVLITPKLGATDTFAETGREQLMQAGEDAAIEALPEIKRLLKAKNII